MPESRRLGRLQIRVVGRESVAGGACVSCERRGLVGEGVVQLAHAGTRRQAERHPECLAAGAARAQPAGGGTADTPLELGLARVERIAERGIPRELVAGNLVQLEQAAHERTSVVTR